METTTKRKVKINLPPKGEKVSKSVKSSVGRKATTARTDVSYYGYQWHELFDSCYKNAEKMMEQLEEEISAEGYVPQNSELPLIGKNSALLHNLFNALTSGIRKKDNERGPVFHKEFSTIFSSLCNSSVADYVKINFIETVSLRDIFHTSTLADNELAQHLYENQGLSACINWTGNFSALGEPILRLPLFASSYPLKTKRICLGLYLAFKEKYQTTPNTFSVKYKVRTVCLCGNPDCINPLHHCFLYAPTARLFHILSKKNPTVLAEVMNAAVEFNWDLRLMHDFVLSLWVREQDLRKLRKENIDSCPVKSYKMAVELFYKDNDDILRDIAGENFFFHKKQQTVENQDTGQLFDVSRLVSEYTWLLIKDKDIKPGTTAYKTLEDYLDNWGVDWDFSPSERLIDLFSPERCKKLTPRYKHEIPDNYNERVLYFYEGFKSNAEEVTAFRERELEEGDDSSSRTTKQSSTDANYYKNYVYATGTPNYNGMPEEEPEKPEDLDPRYFDTNFKYNPETNRFDYVGDTSFVNPFDLATVEKHTIQQNAALKAKGTT